MATFHVLNGDALLENISTTNIGKHFIVCRECLIEGPVSADVNERFWDRRASYLSSESQDGLARYHNEVQDELLKLADIPSESKVYLWFENDLFCQINYWFVLKLISPLALQVYRVYPLHDSAFPWTGFGSLTKGELEEACRFPVKLSESDLEVGVGLWRAYANKDQETLSGLSNFESQSFRYLREAIVALSDLLFSAEPRPEQIIKRLMNEGKSFKELFAAFSEEGSIYGYGDTQIKAMLARLREQ